MSYACGWNRLRRSTSQLKEATADLGKQQEPQKKERAGVTPSYWLRGLQITRLPDPLLGNGAAGGGAGDHPGRATPSLASPARLPARGAQGKEKGGRSWRR